MREIINYLIEANLCLLLFLLVYYGMLKNETSFSLTRFILLLGIILSIAIPFVHLNNAGQAAIPTLGEVIPSNWLPEIVIMPNGENIQSTLRTPATDTWLLVGWIYGIGILLFLGWLCVQVLTILATMRSSKAYAIDDLKVFESDEDRPTFSFFRLIYIGRAGDLSPVEKEQVIRHEAVHARQFHSLDLLLITVLRIAFWFNPVLSLYKKIFIQLHEFEADARAVKDSDVNNYCSLLARVALQSAHFPIASHFNQSLTVKRIEMIRTIKKKVRSWKLGVIAAIIPLIFAAIACQDQLAELEGSTISQTGDYPAEVKAHMDDYMREHPGAKLTYMEGLAEDLDKFTSSPEVVSRTVYNYTFKDGKKGVLLTDVVQHAGSLQSRDKVYMVVEEQPQFPGGFDALKSFLRDNIRYPKDAADAGLTGTVYVSMVIDETGTTSDVKVLRGVSPSIDAEAIRVVRMLPSWIPGRQNGKSVKVRFNLPIKFGAPSGTETGQMPHNTILEQIQADNFRFNVRNLTTDVVAEGKIVIQGRVESENGSALPGVNVVISGTTTGIATDANGNFKLTSTSERGELTFSFVGYNTQIVSFAN